MGAGLKKNGTRAFVAVTAVCAALSPAALAAVGGVSAASRGGGGVAGEAKASRLIRTPPTKMKRVVPARSIRWSRPPYAGERSGWAPGWDRAGRPGRQ